jgi:ribose transport system ATP-binding protein
VPIDRKAAGLILDGSVAENIGLASLEEFSRLGFTARRRLRKAASDCRAVFDIRCQSVDQPVRALSGGNQQKVMLARWHTRRSPYLVIQEPTQGVDIGARQEIHHYLVDFAEQGGCVLFSSSDLEEVRTIAHRIYVMHVGEVVGEFDNTVEPRPTRSELTQAMAAGTATVHEREIYE